MSEQEKLVQFDQVVLPHLAAAYNLARWLTRSEQDAEDVVQEACLRAFRFLDGFRGGDSRAWVLMIVRNTCYTWLKEYRMPSQVTSFDEQVLDVECESANPDLLLQRSADRQLLTQALQALPVEFREVIALRELESLSYKEIAYITNTPIGTVMSRLARARRQLEQQLTSEMKEGGRR